MNLITKVKGKLAYWKRGIAFYGQTAPSQSLSLMELKEIQYKEFSQVKDLSYYQLTKERLKEYKNRFSKGEILCILENDIQIIAYGWINPTPVHYVGELALTIQHKEKCEILYDFETDIAYRGKGLYPFLLQQISKRDLNPKLIYVSVDNIASIKGIKKAGFKYLGSVFGYNKSKAHHLLQKLWQE